MKIVKTAIKSSVLSMLLIAACKEGPIHVEIPDASDHAVYEETLKRNSIKYTVDEKGRFVIKNISPDELALKTKSYEQYQQEKVDKHNREE